VKIGELATRDIVAVSPSDSLRTATRTMVDAGVGSAVVLDDGNLVGIITERDVLHAVARADDPDALRTAAIMTGDVITVEPGWEIYEAAAEMTARRIRHLVVADAGQVVGVVSMRDVLLAGQRIPLSEGGWAVLRDPLTFTIRERRRLQRYLLDTRHGDTAMVDLLGLLVGSWSLPLDLPPDAEKLGSLPAEDHAALRDAVYAELPELQRAVHPSPGWRRR
jgi:CBS domain-containing protein